MQSLVGVAAPRRERPPAGRSPERVAGGQRDSNPRLCPEWAATKTGVTAAAAARRANVGHVRVEPTALARTGGCLLTRLHSTPSATPYGLSFAKTPSGGQVVDLSALIRRQCPSMIST